MLWSPVISSQYKKKERERPLLFRGTTLNRTYVRHKNLYTRYIAIFTNNGRSYLLWSPVILFLSPRQIKLRTKTDWRGVIFSVLFLFNIFSVFKYPPCLRKCRISSIEYLVGFGFCLFTRFYCITPVKGLGFCF